MLSDPKRSCSRFAARTLRCRTEPAFQAVPVFRMAYFPYLTAFRMQAKQIQRLPLRGAGAKRLKGGPLGIGARGRGPQAPSPISAPNRLFELLRCSGRLIELPPRHPAFRRAGVPFGLLATSAPSRLSARWRFVRLIGCLRTIPPYGVLAFRSAYWLRQTLELQSLRDLRQAQTPNSSRFATYGKLKRSTFRFAALTLRTALARRPHLTPAQSKTG